MSKPIPRHFAYTGRVKRARPGTRLWLVAFAGFFLLHAAWALASPYDGPPDEKAHALRAAAVGHGEILTNGWTQDVPRSLVRPSCFPMQPTVAADCTRPPGGDETLAPATVGAVSYNPIYYLVTGWPVAVWPNWTGILLARLLTGAAMAAFLASAVVAACRWIRHKAVLAGVLVAATPMVASLGGSINPNGVEIAAGLALFTGLITVLWERPRPINRSAIVLVGVSASTLATLRALGVMWLGLILLTMLFGASRSHLRELIRERTVRLWSGVVALFVVLALAWNVIAKPLGVANGNMGMSTKEVLRYGVLEMWPNVANQMVGVMGWAETLQPRLVYLAWFAAVGLLVLGGFVLGGRGDKLRLAFLFFGTFVPLLGWELLRANSSGWFNQGRYFLPGAVGLPIIGAYVLARSGFNPDKFRALTRTLAVVLVPIQVVCLAFTMCRWQSGWRILNPLKGSWLPPLGPELPLALGAASVLVLLAMYWRASRLPRSPAYREPEEETATVQEAPAPPVTARAREETALVTVS